MDIVFLNTYRLYSKHLKESNPHGSHSYQDLLLYLFWACFRHRAKHSITHVVLLDSKLGLSVMTFIQNYVADLQMSSLEPFPVGNTADKIILLSTYCLSRQNGGKFLYSQSLFSFRREKPNQNNQGCCFQESFFRTYSATYLTRTKKGIVVTGVKLVTKVEQP